MPSPAMTKSERDHIRQMTEGSERLIEKLRERHPRILHNLVRKNGVGDGSNA